MTMQDVRVDYGLGAVGGPEHSVPDIHGLPGHFTRIQGSVLVRVWGETSDEMFFVTSDGELLDEGFLGLCRALHLTLSTGNGWSRGLMLGREGLELVLRANQARFFKVGLREFSEELFCTARRFFDDAYPALGPIGRRSMERYWEQIEGVEQEVRQELSRNG